MRIAYVAPYQGHALLQRRPVVKNLSLGGRAKIELFAELLLSRFHHVEVLSQGEVVDRAIRYYPGFSESHPFSNSIAVQYASALPVRFLNGFWSSVSTLSRFKAWHRQSPYDLVLIYNLKPPQVACAQYALRHGVPVVLQYEDDQFLGSMARSGTRLSAEYQSKRARHVLSSVSGCVANSPALLSQAPEQIPKLMLSAAVGEEVVRCGLAAPQSSRPNWVVFSGTHAKVQGLESLVRAWRLAPPASWELHIAGHGATTSSLQELARTEPSIVFHGILSRDENAALLAKGKISIVPHDVHVTQGFSFKTAECLAAGLHVITTPLTALAGLTPPLRDGITCIADNEPSTIAASLAEVIATRRYENTAQQAAIAAYGPDAVATCLNNLVNEARAYGRRTP